MEREIKKTNYFILVAMIVLILSICTATYNIYSIYKNNKANYTSPLNLTKEVQFSELNDTTLEIGEDAFLVLSYYGDEDIYQNQKNLKLVFRRYGLLENIIYVDVTQEYEKEGFYNKLNEVLKLKDFKVDKVPSIIYYKEGKPTAIATSTNGIIDSSSLEDIIKNNANVD